MSIPASRGAAARRFRARMARPLVLAALLSCVARAALMAQQPATVLTRHDAALVGEATAGAAALSLLDVRIAHAFGDSAFHARHPGFTTAANRASLATETVLMATGGVVYGLARLRKNDGVADVALHTTESIASAALVIQVVRGVLGRARPYVIDEAGEKKDADPYDFEPLHGFTSFNYRSFPSMHAMASFAAATALTQEMRVRDTPHRAVIGPILYAGAAMPSLARLYLDEHWASDIALGAFLGVLAGQKVVGYSHEHPDNRVDRQFLGHRVSGSVTLDARGYSFSLAPW